MLTENSHLEFHLLRYTYEPDKHNQFRLNTIRKDDLSSITVDKKAIEIYKLLSEGKSIKETAKEMKFSAHVVMAICKIFLQADFIRKIDGKIYDKNQITPHSRLQLYKLRVSSKPDAHSLFALVRWDSDESLKVDSNMLKLIDTLSDGKTVQEAADAINYSVDVVLPVIKMLIDVHFVKSIDDILLDDAPNKIKPWLQSINRRYFSWVLYKPLAILLLLFVTVSIVFGITHYGFPSYKDIFWTKDLFTVLVSMFFLNIFLLFTHESGHFIATKAVGGEAVMRISYRYLFIVAETESFHLAMASKRARYFVYAAGTVVDLCIIALCYQLFLFSGLLQFDIGWLRNFLKLVIITEAIGIVWQFDAFLETDMYNFLTEYLEIENLRSDSLKYIQQHTKRWKKMLLYPIKLILLLFSKEYVRRSDDLRLFNKNERRKLYVYIVVLIAGLVFTTYQYFYYSIPRDITFLYDSFLNIRRALSQSNTLLFIKSVFIIFAISYEYVLLLYLKLLGNKSRIKS